MRFDLRVRAREVVLPYDALPLVPGRGRWLPVHRLLPGDESTSEVVDIDRMGPEKGHVCILLNDSNVL